MGASVELSDRETAVLFAVARSFLRAGAPVGSAEVRRCGGPDVSTATIRSVMARLESRGLLHQPHTSAGRLPTAAGLRIYIDTLKLDAPLGASDPLALRLAEGLEGGAGESAARGAAVLLSELLTIPSIVAESEFERLRIQDVHLSALSNDRVLTVVVTEDERVFDRVVAMRARVTRAELEWMGRYLADFVRGLTLEQVAGRVRDELEAAQRELDDLRRMALAIGERAAEPWAPSVIVEGKLNVLEHAELTADTERLRHLLEVLERTERVAELLDGLLGTPASPMVRIGHEIHADLGDEVGLLVCSYEGAEGMGLLGLIGPSRLDYERVAPLLHYAARLVSALREPQGD